IDYLGTRLQPQVVVPQPIKFDLEIKTLHDMQQLVGTIQWLRGVVGIPPALMAPLFELLKGKAPWEP
ncbi:POK18 protein, partial [Rhinoptilus africanus]|nr:POK18 protein [Rhinoptilus africanus]